MALDDVNFAAGDGQNFLVEFPTATYDGVIEDVMVETDGSSQLIMELPEAAGDIFIMSE